MKLRIVVNPSAGSGSAKRRIPEVVRALGIHGITAEIAEPRGPGDATRLAREARADGVDCIGVMGGDGTLNEVCQAYIDAAGEACAGPDLALLPSGTGGDFRKSFELGT